MKTAAFWILLSLLVILHQDWWFWSDGRLVFGYLPMGLAYHAAFSLAAGALWTWAVFGVFPGMFESEEGEP